MSVDTTTANNVEMIVPLNNLRLLNKMIKYHPGLIKFVKHIKVNGHSALSVITNYNTEEMIKKHLNQIFNVSYNHKVEDDKEFDTFMNRCKVESTREIINPNEVENLMEIYSEFSENPYEKVVKRQNKEIENDEAYMQLYHEIKRNI